VRQLRRPKVGDELRCWRPSRLSGYSMGSSFSAFALVSIAAAPVGRGLHWALLSVSAAFVVLALTFLVVLYCHKRVRSFIAAANRRFPGHMTEFARRRRRCFLDGLLPLRQLSCMLSAITLTAIIWSSRAWVLLPHRAGSLGRHEPERRAFVPRSCQLRVTRASHYRRHRNDRGDCTTLS